MSKFTSLSFLGLVLAMGGCYGAETPEEQGSGIDEVTRPPTPTPRATDGGTARPQTQDSGTIRVLAVSSGNIGGRYVTPGVLGCGFMQGRTETVSVGTCSYEVMYTSCGWRNGGCLCVFQVQSTNGDCDGVAIPEPVPPM